MDDISQKNFAKKYVEFVGKKYELRASNKILVPYHRIFMMGKVGMSVPIME